MAEIAALSLKAHESRACNTQDIMYQISMKEPAAVRMGCLPLWVGQYALLRLAVCGLSHSLPSGCADAVLLALCGGCPWVLEGRRSLEKRQLEAKPFVMALCHIAIAQHLGEGGTAL